MSGGTAFLLARSGHMVKFVSCTDGSAGHQTMEPKILATRRLKEAHASAKRIGLVDYEVLNIPDGHLMPTVENRERIIRLIRTFAPDVIITHRLCDYHADHRATAQLVQDASYLLIVPLVCPETSALRTNPAILFSWDHFQKPNPFIASIAVDISSVIDEKIKLYDCHASQFYEWLPFIEGMENNVPVGKEQRLGWGKQNWAHREQLQAEQCRQLLIRSYGEKGWDAKYAESFELSEYGRQATNAELVELFVNSTAGK